MRKKVQKRQNQRIFMCGQSVVIPDALLLRRFISFQCVNTASWYPSGPRLIPS